MYTEGVPRAEWPSIRSRWDARFMGRWNVRCRATQMVQSLGLWRLRQGTPLDFHALVMGWVEAEVAAGRLQR